MIANLARVFALVVAGVVLAGCAADTSQIEAEYVSPEDYGDYDCTRIEGEAKRVSRKAQEIGARVDKAAANDDAQTAVGIVFFWPTLFLLEGEETGDTRAYAELKGQFEALEEASIRKECAIEFRELAPSSTGQMHVPEPESEPSE